MHELPATAGQVRLVGPAAMLPRARTRRAAGALAVLSALALVSGVVLSHLVPGSTPYRLAGAGLALVAVALSWRHVPRDSRGENVAFGVALAVLFLGLTEALGWPNRVAGPAFVLLALAASAFSLRNRPPSARTTSPAGRLHAALLVLGVLWIVAVLGLLAGFEDLA